MWRRKPELWQRSESCSFSVFLTAASGAAANQFHIRVWFVLKLLSKLTPGNNTQVNLKTGPWEMVHHVDSSAVHSC